MDLSVGEDLGIHDVVLGVIDIQGALCLEHDHHILQTLFACEKLGIDLEVHLRALCEAGVRQVADGLQECGRAVDVRAAGRADAVCQRCPCIAAGRKSADALADRDVAGDGQHACGQLAERGIILLDLVDQEVVDLARAEVCSGIVVAVLGSVPAHLLNVLVALEVGVESLAELVHGDLLLIVDQVLDVRDGVDDIGLADDVDAVADVELGAAVGVVLAGYHAVGIGQGQGGNGAVVLAEVVEVGIHGRHGVDEVLDLLLDGIHELVKGLEAAGIAGLDGDELAGLAAAAVVHDHVHDTAHGDLADIGVGFQTALEVGLDTSAGSPVPCLGERNALVEQHLDAGVVVVDGGHGAAHADALGSLAQEGIRVLGDAVADSHVGLFGSRVHGGLDGHVGQLVDCVVAIFGDTAGADLDGHVVACGEGCGLAVLEEAHLGDLDPEAVHQLLCAVLGQDAGCDVLSVEVDQVLVHTAQVVGGSILLHEDAVLIGQHGLQAFVEGAGGMLGNPAVDLGDLEELSLADGILLFRCHLLSQIGVAVCVGNDAFRGDDQGFVEDHLLEDILAACSVQGSQLLFGFLLDAADALGQEGSPAGGVLAVAADELLVDIEHAAVAHGADIIGHHGIPAVQHALAAPVGSDLFHEELLVLLGEIEGIIGAGADGVELLLDNGAGGIGIQDTCAGLESNAADQQLIVLDVDGLVLIDGLHGCCLLDGPGLTLGGLEALCHIVGIQNIHLDAVGEVVLTQLVDSVHILFCHGNPPF